VNQSEDVVLADGVELARDLWSRFVGLMGRRSLEPGRCLVLEPASSIHMFFMRFPIDAVFVDRDWKVLHISHGIKPWRVSRIVLGAKRVIELPAGTCQQTNTQTNQFLALT
jgi:uncharacterized membrane protein (UPF0127 family)